MKDFLIPTISLTILIFIVIMALVLWCTMEGFTGGTPHYSPFCGIDLVGGRGSGFNGIHEIIIYLIIALVPSTLIVILYKGFKK